MPICSISGLLRIIRAFFLISPRSEGGVSPSKVAKSADLNKSGQKSSRKVRNWSCARAFVGNRYSARPSGCDKKCLQHRDIVTKGLTAGAGGNDNHVFALAGLIYRFRLVCIERQKLWFFRHSSRAGKGVFPAQRIWHHAGGYARCAQSARNKQVEKLNS